MILIYVAAMLVVVVGLAFVVLGIVLGSREGGVDARAVAGVIGALGCLFALAGAAVFVGTAVLMVL